MVNHTPGPDPICPCNVCTRLRGIITIEATFTLTPPRCKICGHPTDHDGTPHNAAWAKELYQRGRHTLDEWSVAAWENRPPPD